MKKYIIVLVLIVFSTTLIAQPTEKELKKHNKEILNSKENSKGIMSLDSFYCNGEALAKVNVLKKSLLMGVEEQTIQCFKSIVPQIIVTKLSYKNNQNIDVYYEHYEFTTLNLKCDVPVTIGGLSVYGNLCKYQLFNKNGLDTNKVETFVVIKGQIKTPVSVVQSTPTNNDYNVIVPRNKEAFLFFFGDVIQQDQVNIGTIVKSRVQTINGFVDQYQVFNSKSTLICTITQSAIASSDWNFLIYKDNKFTTQNIGFGKEKEEITKYLIKFGYL